MLLKVLVFKFWCLTGLNGSSCGNVEIVAMWNVVNLVLFLDALLEGENPENFQK